MGLIKVRTSLELYGALLGGSAAGASSQPYCGSEEYRVGLRREESQPFLLFVVRVLASSAVAKVNVIPVDLFAPTTDALTLSLAADSFRGIKTRSLVPV